MPTGDGVSQIKKEKLVSAAQIPLFRKILTEGNVLYIVMENVFVSNTKRDTYEGYKY